MIRVLSRMLACAAAVQFYLHDARAKERDILRDLAKEGPEVNQKIMGYIREAQREYLHRPRPCAVLTCAYRAGSPDPRLVPGSCNRSRPAGGGEGPTGVQARGPCVRGH